MSEGSDLDREIRKQGRDAAKQYHDFAKQIAEEFTNEVADGYDTLDDFAMAALTALLSNPAAVNWPRSQIAATAYDVAEAMMNERENRKSAAPAPSPTPE